MGHFVIHTTTFVMVPPDRDVYEDLKMKGVIVLKEEVAPPTVPMDFNWARVSGCMFHPPGSRLYCLVCVPSPQELGLIPDPCVPSFPQELGPILHDEYRWQARPGAWADPGSLIRCSLLPPRSWVWSLLPNSLFPLPMSWVWSLIGCSLSPGAGTDPWFLVCCSLSPGAGTDPWSLIACVFPPSSRSWDWSLIPVCSLLPPRSWDWSLIRCSLIPVCSLLPPGAGTDPWTAVP